MSQPRFPKEDAKSDSKFNSRPVMQGTSGTAADVREPELKKYPLLFDSFIQPTAEKIAVLKADKGPDGQRYAEIIKSLTQIANLNARNDINRHLIDLLKVLFLDAMNTYDISSANKIELCIAGSLARNQATPYSDIDSFLIFDDSVDQKQKKELQRIANIIFFLADHLFELTHQFPMDPVGISIARFNGTVDELLDKIMTMEPDDADKKSASESNIGVYTMSVSNAKSISGRNQLLEHLQKQITKRVDNTYYFDKAITDFAGPRETKQNSLNIKRDLLRPVDFILQGFRKNENLSVQEFDDPKKILKELVRRNVITDQVKNLIEYIQVKSYELRFKVHAEAKKEQDQMDNPTKEALELLNLVGWLRGSLKVYLNKKTKTFDLYLGKYLSSNVNQDQLSKNRYTEIERIQLEKYAMLRQFKSSDEKSVVTILASPAPDLKSVRKTQIDPANDSVLAKNVLKLLTPRLTANEAKEFYKVIKKGGYHFTGELAEKVIEIVKNNGSYDIRRRIGQILTESQNEKKDSSINVGALSRLFNVIPSPFQTNEAETIAARLNAQVSPCLRSDRKDVDSLKINIYEPIQQWLNDTMLDYVLPQILQADGKIRPVLWDTLYFDELFGKQEELTKKSLNEVTFALIGSFIVNIVSALPQVFQFQLKEQCSQLISATMNDILKDKRYLENVVAQYSLLNIKKMLLKRAENMPHPYHHKFQDRVREAILSFSKLDHDFVKIKKFMGSNNSESKVMCFLKCAEIERVLIKKVSKLTQDISKIKEEKVINQDLLTTKIEKKYLLLRVIMDVQDFQENRISLDQLIINFDVYLATSATIKHGSYIKNMPESVQPQTATTDFFAKMVAQFKELKEYEEFEQLPGSKLTY